MKKTFSALHEAIGETPMVRFSRITKEFGVEGEILAKVEYLNPGFSKKEVIFFQD